MDTWVEEGWSFLEAAAAGGAPTREVVSWSLTRLLTHYHLLVLQ